MHVELVPRSATTEPPDAVPPATTARSRRTAILAVLGLAVVGAFVVATGAQDRQEPPPAQPIRQRAVPAVSAFDPVARDLDEARLDGSEPGRVICAPDDHPASADLAGLLPVNLVPSVDTREVLLGEVEVGGGWMICHVLSPAAGDDS